MDVELASAFLPWKALEGEACLGCPHSPWHSTGSMLPRGIRTKEHFGTAPCGQSLGTRGGWGVAVLQGGLAGHLGTEALEGWVLPRLALLLS